MISRTHEVNRSFSVFNLGKNRVVCHPKQMTLYDTLRVIGGVRHTVVWQKQQTPRGTCLLLDRVVIYE